MTDSEQITLAETPEAYAGNEALAEAEQWLNFAANHPAKLVAVLVLSKTQEPLSKTQLDQELASRCGGAVPYAPGTAFGWGDTLAQTPGVRYTTTTAVVSRHPRQVPALETTEAGDRDGVALAGILLDWQLKHPELPLPKLLGSSSSKVNGAYAPTLRMLMLADLVDQHDNENGPSITTLASTLPGRSNTKQQTVSTLELEGFLDVKSQQVENGREFRIVDPVYRPTGTRARRYEKLKPETKMLYEAFQAAHGIRDVWTVDEFLRLVDERTDSIAPEQMKKMRLRLQQSLAPSQRDFKGVVEPLSGQPYEAKSLVKLKPDMLDAVADLVGLFDGFAGKDPAILNKGRELADALYGNPAVLGWLMRYSHEISSYTSFDTNKLRHILDVIGSSPELTTREVTEGYRTLYGKRLGIEAVRATLVDARDNSGIVSKSTRMHAIKDKKVPVHRIPDRV